jgi:CheY-like chemotaxis protein
MSSARRDTRPAQEPPAVLVASPRSRARRASRPAPCSPRAQVASAPEWQASTNTTDGALALLDTTTTETQPALRRVPAHRHILIVEDDPLVAGVMRNTLELEGDAAWDVRLATEGARALELARAAAPDVVLLDVRLPGLDSAEVYRRLRANPRTRRAIVLFLTAGTTLDLVRRGIEDGLFLRKPFDVRELARIVRALLEA